MIWIIPLILLVLSILVLLGLLFQKIPQLRVMNVDSSSKERSKRVKEQLILKKFQRTGGEKMKGVVGLTQSLVKILSRTGRRAVQRLYALEQYYQKVKRTSAEGHHAYNDETIQRMIKEAEALWQKEEMIPAEKLYIDIISHNPKSVDAYEGLGNLYLENKQHEQARETFQFALRLSPEDASVSVSLAELEIDLGQPKLALVHLRKAIQKRPKNPRYLDFYIDTSLKAGSLKDASEGIKRLKEVNPENKKIAEFETRFSEQKALYEIKTDVDTKGSSQTK